MPESEYVGWWWLPDDREGEVPGTLSFSEQSGWQLSLMGTFGSTKRLVKQTNIGIVFPVIYGVIPEKEVTLVSCTSIGRRGSSSGNVRVSYRVGIAYIGELIKDAAVFTFSHLDFEPTYLADWLDAPKVYSHPPITTETGTRYEFGFEHQEPEYRDMGSGKVSIAYSMSSRLGTMSADIKVRPVISFRIEEALSIDDWRRDHLLPVANLLSLATTRPVRPAGLAVFLGDESEPRPIKVIARNLPDRQEDESRLTPYDMLFSHRELDCSFAELLATWLKVHRELESVLNLYFSIARSPSMYLEHQFLSLAQALEGYHRCRYTGLDTEPEKHEARVTAILQAAPEEHREWLNEQLKYSHEKSLRRRLSELVASAGEAFKPWVPNSDKRTRFIHRVWSTRNTLTHHGPRSSTGKLDSEKLFVLTEALSILMQALLLGEAGFDDGKRARLFRQNQRYQFAAERAAR